MHGRYRWPRRRRRCGSIYAWRATYRRPGENVYCCDIRQDAERRHRTKRTPKGMTRHHGVDYMVSLSSRRLIKDDADTAIRAAYVACASWDATLPRNINIRHFRSSACGVGIDDMMTSAQQARPWHGIEPLDALGCKSVPDRRPW